MEKTIHCHLQLIKNLYDLIFGSSGETQQTENAKK
jgi:hypothetical protein